MNYEEDVKGKNSYIPIEETSAFTAAPCSVLRLTLKRKWFDMIASGEKKEEYREAGKWILSRLVGKDYRPRKYDVIEFKNGYGKDVPTGTGRGVGQLAISSSSINLVELKTHQCRGDHPMTYRNPKTPPPLLAQEKPDASALGAVLGSRSLSEVIASLEECLADAISSECYVVSIPLRGDIAALKIISANTKNTQSDK